MPQRIEFAKLLNPRELTHLVLGRRKGGVCFAFCGIVLVIWLGLTAWLWMPDSLRPSDVVSHGDVFGLDCGNMPSEDPMYAECTTVNATLADYRKSFGSEAHLTVDFDGAGAADTSTRVTAMGSVYDGGHIERVQYDTSDEGSSFAPPSPKPAVTKSRKSSPRFKTQARPQPVETHPDVFLKRYVCPVKRTYALEKLEPGQVRFLYYLLARNTGKTCAIERLGARSRLVRVMGLDGAGIVLGGWASALIDFAWLVLSLGLIVMTLLTRRAYLWLYGSYHVRSRE